jgi:hypothetical protein
MLGFLSFLWAFGRIIKMNEAEKIKKECEFIIKIADAINENLHIWGIFELWQKDNSLIYGSEFSIAHDGETYYIKVHEGEKINAKININSLKFIGPKIYVIEQKESDKNE